MSEQRRSAGMFASLAAGVIIGAVEAVLAIAFAAFVFGGLLVSRLADGIGLYLVAAALTLGILAWRAGRRGVVGSVQDAAAAVLAVVASTTAAKAADITKVAQAGRPEGYEKPDVFLTVIAATLVVTVLCGIVFLALGTFRLGNLVRFVPYPVVGGFLAGTGWLLFKGGIYVASGIEVHLRTIGLMLHSEALKHSLPALAFGVILLFAVRLVKKPLVIPIVLGVGLVVFAIGMLVTGSSIDDARRTVDGSSGRSRRPGCGNRGRSARSAAPTGRRCSDKPPPSPPPCSSPRSPSCSTSAGPRSCCTGTSTRTGSFATPDSSTSSPARSAASPAITRSA